jgi:hypothetical protein
MAIAPKDGLNIIDPDSCRAQTSEDPIGSVFIRLQPGSTSRSHVDANELADDVAVPARLELATFGLGNRCSIRLSYGTNKDAANL